MSLLDIEHLLKEISAESPCGEDLEYDPEFGEMERAAQGKPEQQIGESLIPAQEPDNITVSKKAKKLFERTKDLRVAVYLTQSLVHSNGFLGLRDGLALIKGLLENYWDSVHPQLDPADGNDPTLRINTLASLCDPSTMMQSVRGAVLLNSSVFGRFSLRDVLIALGKLTLTASSKEQPIEISTINGAFMDADLTELQSIADAIRQSIGSLAAIESLLTDKVGSMQMIDFSSLPHLLMEAQQIMSEHLIQRGVSDTEPSTELETESHGKPVAQKPMTGRIDTREDVIRAIDMACEYYKRHEPSSPVPLLLQRAKRLVSKDFMEILRDLTPAGVTQAEEIGGIPKQ